MKTKRHLIQICLLGVLLLQTASSGAQTVTKIAAGGNHSLFLKSDSSLWGMGWNAYGELGDGTYNQADEPEQIVASNVMAIAAGHGHSLFLKNDGSLWCTGWNDEGQLGDSVDSFWAKTNSPEQIVASNVTAIAGGDGHSLFIKNDGSLWGMGDNSWGQLGVGSTTNSAYQPELIVASNVTAIAAGGNHSLFIKSDGSLWAMGWNAHGQLGDGSFSSFVITPEQIVASNVTAIAAGDSHSLFLKSDGSLWAMGWNDNGQLGDGTHNYMVASPEQIVASNVLAIAAGGYHSLFIKNDGSLWEMGDNDAGELGDETYKETNIPKQVVVGNVRAIAAGQFHNLFITSDGSLWGMGFDNEGELGNGTNHCCGRELIDTNYPEYYEGTNNSRISLFTETNLPEQIVTGSIVPFGSNHILVHLLSGGNVQLSCVGIARTKYALERSTSLALANWVPQGTNTSDSVGGLVFTNAPDPTANNFWRIRCVQ